MSSPSVSEARCSFVSVASNREERARNSIYLLFTHTILKDYTFDRVARLLKSDLLKLLSIIMPGDYGKPYENVLSLGNCLFHCMKPGYWLFLEISISAKLLGTDYFST